MNLHKSGSFSPRSSMPPSAHFESAKKNQVIHFRTEDFEKAIRGMAPEKQAFARMLFPKDATGKWMKTNQAKLEVFAETLNPHERAFLSVRVKESNPYLMPGAPPSEARGPQVRRPTPEPGPRVSRPTPKPAPQQASRPAPKPAPQQPSRSAQEQAPQRASSRPAQEQAPQQATRQPAQEQAPQQASSRPAQEQAPQQASSRPAQEQAPQQATSQPAQEQAPQQTTRQPAQDPAPQQATSQPTQEQAPQQATRQAAQEQAPQQAHQPSQEAAPQEAHQPAHEAESTPVSGSTSTNAPDRPNHPTSAGDGDQTHSQPTNQDESEPKPKGIMGWLSSLSTTKKILYGGLAFLGLVFVTRTADDEKDKPKEPPKNPEC